MKRLKLLKQKLRVYKTLSEAIGAMRSLSAHHFRLARKALPTSRIYREEVARALAAVPFHWPRVPGAPTGFVVVSSDLGLCGEYNLALAQAAMTAVDEATLGRTRPVGPIYSVGRRARTILAQANLIPRRLYPATTSVAGLTTLLLHLAEHLFDDFRAGEFGDLVVISARFEGAGKFSPIHTHVLPIDPTDNDHPAGAPHPKDLGQGDGERVERLGARLEGISPYVRPDELSAVLGREYLFAVLDQLLLDALASEHGIRLITVETARRWLDDKMTSTRKQILAGGREATTQEVLDVIAGGKANRATRGG